MSGSNRLIRSSWLLLALAGVFAITYLARAIYSALTSPLRQIPGPWYSHLTNARLKLAVVSGRRIHYIHSLHEKYGKIVLVAPGEVSVSDVDGFKKVHAIGGGFRKSDWYENLARMPRPGVFSMSDIKEHASRRRLLARPFSKTALRQNWEPVVRDKVQAAVRKMGEEARTEGKTDALKWLHFMATDVSARLMFGEDFGMLELGKKNEYMRTLETTLMLSGIASELTWVRTFCEWTPIDAVRKFFDPSRNLLAYGSTAIAHARAHGGSSNVFAGMLDKADKGADLDEMDVNVEAANLLVAGTDTTAITATYLIWAVLGHPNVKNQLEEEVSKLSSDFSDADLEALPYLNAVVSETLRLYGAAPGSLPRIVPDGGVNIGGYHIPGRTIVGTQAYTIHRDSSIFPDPDKLNPNRFLHDVSESARTAYSPFGAGSRVCLGVHLALMELRYVGAFFFRDHRARATIAASTTADSMEMENYFLIAPKAHMMEIEIG